MVVAISAIYAHRRFKSVLVHENISELYRVSPDSTPALYPEPLGPRL